MENGFSAPFADAIMDAINQVLAKDGGGICTGLAGGASFLGQDGNQGFIVFAPETQPISSTLGLLDFVQEHTRIHTRSMIMYSYRDEDE